MVRPTRILSLISQLHPLQVPECIQDSSCNLLCCCRVGKSFNVLEEQPSGPGSLLDNDGIAIRDRGGWINAVLAESTA